MTAPSDTDIEIVPLSVSNILQTYRLAKRIFPKDGFSIVLGHIYSLLPKSIMHMTSPLATSVSMQTLDYFVAYKKGTHELVGMTGLYAIKDRTEAWIGWYGVDPDARGQHYGKHVLDWTIEEATERGFETLRLWASTEGESAIANQQYVKRGFVAQDVGADKRNPGGRILLYAINLKGGAVEPFRGSLREPLMREYDTLIQ